MKGFWKCLVILAMLSLPSFAQEVPYQQLLLLVSGPSGDRIDPVEQEVVEYLNGVRSSYGLNQLQMGTMHFDRPKEAKILQSPLGFPTRGVTVGLVQLSPQGLPLRTLYKIENARRATIELEHQKLLAQWSRLSQQTLPAGLTGQKPQVPPGPDKPVSAVTPPATRPNQLQQIFTFEGLRSIILTTHQTTDGLWQNVKERALREDGLDVPVREATLRLTEATLNLRHAHEQGVLYPVERLLAVQAAGVQWQATQPHLYLPVDLRQQVEPLSHLLDQLDQILIQAQSQVSP